MEYYAAERKQKEFLPFATALMGLKDLPLALYKETWINIQNNFILDNKGIGENSEKHWMQNVICYVLLGKSGILYIRKPQRYETQR